MLALDVGTTGVTALVAPEQGRVLRPALAGATSEDDASASASS